MKYELWEEDPVRQQGNWSLFPVDQDYDRHLATNGPELKFSRSFEAGSFDEAMNVAHEYLGLPPREPPNFAS